MRKLLSRFLVFAVVLTGARATLSGQLDFITYDQAGPILETYRQSLPAQLKDRPPQRLRAEWATWVRQRDREVRARLDRGDEDTLTNLLRYGVTYTSQPRIDWSDLFQYGENAGANLLVSNRADDLVRALAAPGNNERLLTMRAFVEKKGLTPSAPVGRTALKKYLLANLLRMQKEFAGYREELRKLQATHADPAKFAELDAHLFQQRGISLDTDLRPNFAFEQTLKELASKGLLAADKIRRVAIVGPGLDVVNKENGTDFYPPQTVQPFAVIDSLLRLGLANAKSLDIVTYDIGTTVNAHIARAVRQATRGRAYTVQLVLDSSQPWNDDFVSYWKKFGDQIGGPGVAVKVPEEAPEFSIRAIKVRPEAVKRITPSDMNVVFQRAALPPSEQFDLVVGTNVFVYYSAFEQALARSNLAVMLRPGGWLLSNNPLSDGTSALSDAGRTLVPVLARGAPETMYWYRREK